ncbi:MAG: nitrous oxide reductase accessory protein NosL [Balneolaceae bacterium]
MRRTSQASIGVVLLFVLILSGCTQGPRELSMGEEECAHCRMMLSESAYASQVVMNRGRSFPFDSIECMVAFWVTHIEPESIHSVWVPDFRNEDVWLDATTAVYLQSETMRSPMGLSLSAYDSEESARLQMEESGGRLLSWEELQELVAVEWELISEGQTGNQYE